MKMRQRTLMNGDEPAIEQPDRNGWNISWNPDNGMFYVTHPTTGETVRMYRNRNNAMYWADRNPV